MVSTEQETRVRGLLQQSERAHAARETARAGELLDEARRLAPEHPMVLNVSAARALESGQGPQAVELLRRALAADPRSVTLWLNLAATYRRLGDAEGESEALDGALALEPRHLPALLHKGALRKRRGDVRAAALVYADALKTIPPGTKLPEALRADVTAAVETVRANATDLDQFLAERLRGLRDAGDGTARVDHAIDALLGKRRIYHPEPTQLHVPMLPAYEFYPREHFPWLAQLEAGSAAVREEFEAVFARDQDRLEPYIAYPDGVPLDQWAELNRSRRWSAFFLWRGGKPMEDNLARCPRTAELLASLPLHTVPGRAPTVFFSIMDPGVHIPPHTGVTNSRLIVHLPLVLPGKCRFRVGSTTREWRFGEAWVFDDSIDHEAWNDSALPRAILIFDVWNPFLSDAERSLISEATVAFSDFYGEATLAAHYGGGAG